MGLLCALLGNASEVDASKLEKEFADLLIEGESIHQAYKFFLSRPHRFHKLPPLPYGQEGHNRQEALILKRPQKEHRLLLERIRRSL